MNYIIMQLRIFYITLAGLLLTGSLLAQEFSITEKKLIAYNIDLLLINYQKYGILSEDGAGISDLYVNRLNELFSSKRDIYIYNDIDPEKLLDEKITLQEYIFKVKSWYTAGLAMKLTWDAMLMSEPVRLPDSKKNYAVSLLLEKQVMGIYKSKRIINNTNDLFFIIEFEKSRNNYTNFKIAGIQKQRPVLEIPEEPEVAVAEKKKEPEKKEETEKKEVAEKKKETEKKEVPEKKKEPEKKEEPEKVKKAEKETEPQKEKPAEKKTDKSISLYFSPLYTQIYSKDIFSDDNWQAEGAIGYCGGAGFTYYPGKSLGVFGGLSLTNYKTNLTLENFNLETNTIQLVDKDNDFYYRYIQADIEEQNSLTYLDVSLGVNLNKFFREENIGVYLNSGCQFSYLLMSKYIVTGSSTHMGYYPEYHVVLYDLPDYDFTSENLDDENDWDLNSYNISAYMSIGLLAKLHSMLYLNAGPFIIYGFGDLKYDTAKHRDDYISTVGIPGRTNTRALGLNISLVFIL